MTNTEAPSIDLDELERLAALAVTESEDLRSGSCEHMDNLSEVTSDPAVIAALVAAVKAARDYVADHGQDVVEPECVSCKALLDALHPFTVTK